MVFGAEMDAYKSSRNQFLVVFLAAPIFTVFSRFFRLLFIPWIRIQVELDADPKLLSEAS